MALNISTRSEKIIHLNLTDRHAPFCDSVGLFDIHELLAVIDYSELESGSCFRKLLMRILELRLCSLSRYDTLFWPFLQGIVNGRRRRGTQRESWDDDIKE